MVLEVMLVLVVFLVRSLILIVRVLAMVLVPEVKEVPLLYLRQEQVTQV
jgi:hypothetical protein